MHQDINNNNHKGNTNKMATEKTVSDYVATISSNLEAGKYTPTAPAVAPHHRGEQRKQIKAAYEADVVRVNSLFNEDTIELLGLDDVEEAAQVLLTLSEGEYPTNFVKRAEFVEKFIVLIQS